MTSDQGTPPELRGDVAHPARVYDYWLGGRDNYAVDREVAERIIAADPTVLGGTRANRAFLQRAVRYLAEEAGIRQFLDIGSGLPTQNNVHEVAQRSAPESRVVYVDNDPIVLVHARALLTGTTEGRTEVVQADLREPGRLLEHPEVREVLDFAEPVAVLMVAMLHYVTAQHDPYGIVSAFRAAMAPGSHLVLSHITPELLEPQVADQVFGAFTRAGIPVARRGKAEIEAFLDGFEILEPGVVQVAGWRPDRDVPAGYRAAPVYAGVGAIRATGPRPGPAVTVSSP